MPLQTYNVVRGTQLPSTSDFDCSGLALVAPWGSASDPGHFGYLRAALRTRLGEHFLRFGSWNECGSARDVGPR
jgi:hypothetical protein